MNMNLIWKLTNCRNNDGDDDVHDEASRREREKKNIKLCQKKKSSVGVTCHWAMNDEHPSEIIFLLRQVASTDFSLLPFLPIRSHKMGQQKKKENGARRWRTEKHPHFFRFHFIHKRNETKTKIISFEISGYRLAIEWLNYVWLSVINVRPGPESIKWLFDSFYANKLWRTSVVRLIRGRRTKP